MYSSKNVHSQSDSSIEMAIKCLLPDEKKLNTIRKIREFLNSYGSQKMEKYKCCINYCMLFNIEVDEELTCHVCKLGFNIITISR